MAPGPSGGITSEGKGRNAGCCLRFSFYARWPSARGRYRAVGCPAYAASAQNLSQNHRSRPDRPWWPCVLSSRVRPTGRSAATDGNRCLAVVVQPRDHIWDMRRWFATALIAVVVLGNGAASCIYSGVGPSTTGLPGSITPFNPVLRVVTDLLTLPVPTSGIADLRDVALPVALATALLVLAAGVLAGGTPSTRAARIGAAGDLTEHLAHKTEQPERSEVAPDQSECPQAAPDQSERAQTAIESLPVRVEAACDSPMRAEAAEGQPVRLGAAAAAADSAEGRWDGPVAWIAAVAAVVTLLSICSAWSNGTAALSWGWIARFVVGAGWALLIARAFSPRMVRQTVAALLALGLVAMLLAIADRADRGLLHFRWPIGPITATAALAAVWTALAATWASMLVIERKSQASARRLPFWGTVLFLVLVAAAAVYVLQQTGRRAPGLGLAAGVLAGAAIVLRSRFRSRRLDAGFCVLAILAFGGAAVYCAGQLRSPTRVTSGPVSLRLALWRLSGELIAERPWLGGGPDTFVVEMTNKTAPYRAEAPQFFHGNVDPYAHNEWLQAAAELGLPAAAAYLALPLGLVFLAARRRTCCGGSCDSPEQRAVVVALTAGLVTIVALEFASITLRTPIMPVWYWTVLGLLAAALRTAPPEPQPVLQPVTAERAPGAQDAHVPCEERDGAVPRAIPAKTVVWGLLAAACLGVSWHEVNNALVKTDPAAAARRGAGGLRLCADKTIGAWHRAARIALAKAEATSASGDIQSARAAWKHLYELMPAYLDVPADYAKSLLLAGRTDEARTILRSSLKTGFDPYNVAANTLYAKLLIDDPVGRLRCVQRALRAGEFDESLRAVLLDALAHPDAAQALENDLPKARAVARGEADGDSIVDATVELLRVNAAWDMARGRPAEAIADQRLAAEFYERLEETNNRYRRTHAAETDAFLTLARWLYEQAAADYEAAYAAVLLAERYAVLGISHELVAHPEPDQGFVGGVVIPTELPPRLTPLWKLSALLHVVAGHDQDYALLARVMSSLPPEQRTQDGIRRELARVYAQAYEDLRRLPKDRRPPYFAHVSEMAEQLSPGATSSPVPSPP